LTLIDWRERKRLLVLFCVLSSFGWSGAAAQSITTGALQGRVADASGGSVGEVLITLTNVSSGATRTATTGMGGDFRFSQLPAGEFELLIEHARYQPVRVTAIPMRPGQRVGVQVTLSPSTGPVTAPQVVPFQGGVLSGTLPQFGEWFPSPHISALPQRSRELTEVLRLSSSAAGFGGVEGLPAYLMGNTVDALPYRSAHPIIATALRFTNIGVPLGSIEAAQLATNGVDVERSGFAGAILNSFSRRGTGDTQARLLAQYTASSTGDELSGVENPMDAQAAAILSGALMRDSAHFFIGAEVRRYDTPFPSLWGTIADADDVVSAAEQSDINLQSYLQPRLARTDAATVFGGTEWQLTARHRIEGRASFGVAPHGDADVNHDVFGVENQATATAVLGRVALLSDLSMTSANELRVGFNIDGIDFEPQSEGIFATGESLPLTSIVGGLTFGGSDLTSNYRRREFSLADAFTTSGTQHQLKVGASAEVASVEQTRDFAGVPRAFFGGFTQFEAREGFLIQPIGSAGTAEFTLVQLSAFAQDTWRPLAGLEVLAGLRYDHEMLPASDVPANEEWSRLTGLSNTNIPSSYGKLSPRFSIKWDPQEKHRWIFGGGIGVYHATADADVISELIGNDGRSRILRRFGTLSDWPSPTTDTAGSARSLTLVASGYRPPVSTRASIGLTRMLDPRSALHVAGTYRITNNLPRRVDLNAWPTQLLEDQHGRPLFAELVQQGELIGADPATSRRFSGFDHVIGVNSDGESTYRAVTIILERTHGSGIGVYASYTYSQTEDNWYGARIANGGLIGPRLETGSEWEDGTSDFDVPHRLAISAEIPGPAGVTLAALFRYESGMPFTPALPDGVDINGDGFANDPAFIDEGISGLSDIVSDWGCLRSQIDQFAERNSCRSDAIQTLDLRLSARLLRSGSRTLQINLDALNVLQSEIGIVDQALYGVDPDGQLTTTDGRTTIPFIANPQFGEIRQRTSLPRMLRLGVQYNW
jgi:hypothetical protein